MSIWEAKMITWGVNVNGLKLPLSADLSAQLERRYQSSDQKPLVEIDGSKCPLRLNKHDMCLECASVMESGDEFPQAFCDNRDKHIFGLLLFREGNYIWEWNNGERWVPLEGADLEKIEKHYNDRKYGSPVYHCFGDGGSTCVNFNKMTTECSSAKCFLQHRRKNIPDDHLTFQIRRRTK